MIYNHNCHVDSYNNHEYNYYLENNTYHNPDVWSYLPLWYHFQGEYDVGCPFLYVSANILLLLITWLHSLIFFCETSPQLYHPWKPRGKRLRKWRTLSYRCCNPVMWCAQVFTLLSRVWSRIFMLPLLYLYIVAVANEGPLVKCNWPLAFPSAFLLEFSTWLFSVTVIVLIDRLQCYLVLILDVICSATNATQGFQL